MDQKNGDGIRADITALKYGHNNIAELLDKLRYWFQFFPHMLSQKHKFISYVKYFYSNRASSLSTSMLRSQLLPGSKPLARPQVKLLGHSGSGKSSLAASLKAGLFHALFRRSTSLNVRCLLFFVCSYIYKYFS